ncbi:hypothetical protein CGCS363_v001403 [Colletotrichum siamense]|uniref:uncharacterized protein n=1 Tax=Colletotrichum siamense TaxID=690259 RepID=UPI001872A691|nr:uncharacterized protein CGCS363_v001403 [Colletotrichum siamense]KAF5516433.1 hypothetical protein CGCS363_v001403 [Colletotrichum siamense]
MDHFNATVHNGNLVSTRRGLQVSRSKHQGTQFINTSAASGSSHEEPTASDPSRPLDQKYKFLSQPKEPRRSVSKRGNSSHNSSDDEKYRVRKARASKKAQEPGFVMETSAQQGTVEAAIFDDTWRIPRSPIPWLASWMGNLSEREKCLVQLYLKLAPTKMYPCEQILEYNPVRGSAFIERIKSSETSLNAVLMTACYAEMFSQGEWSSPELLYHVSKVCSLVNDRLSDRTKRDFDQGMLECVAQLAITGWNVGRYDHWKVHMQGLKHMIELEGGMKREWNYLLNMIRRQVTLADVKGAVYLGLLPYLDYPRFFNATTDALPDHVRTRIVNEMSNILYQCGLQSYLINAMISTALFAGVLRLAFASPNREVLLNPEAFIEEWLWCEYQLVLYGGALREDCLNDSLGELDELTVAADLGNSEAVAAAMVRSLYTTKPVPSPAENLLEPVLRTAAIVYLETIVPDEPRNPMVYSVPLNLLSASVHKLTQKLQERQSREADDGEGDFDDGLPSMEALRPVMIWACLVGSVMSKLCEMDLVTMGILFDRGYYGQCLSLVIGPEPEHVDRLTEKDLALCKLLDARGLRIRQQDERALLRALLREHAYGCPLLDLAYV